MAVGSSDYWVNRSNSRFVVELFDRAPGHLAPALGGNTRPIRSADDPRINPRKHADLVVATFRPLARATRTAFGRRLAGLSDDSHRARQPHRLSHLGTARADGQCLAQIEVSQSHLPRPGLYDRI